MKRPPKAFVVERKRRSRPSTATPPSIWTGTAGRQMRELASARERAEAEAAANPIREPSQASLPDPIPKSGLRGRILEARVEPGVASPVVEPEDANNRSVVSAAWAPDFASNVSAPGSSNISKAAAASSGDCQDNAVTLKPAAVTAIAETPTTP